MTWCARERDYILTHAGINSADSQAWRADNPEADLSDHAVLENYLAQRDEEELLWVRDWFWGMPTGLVDSPGHGSRRRRWPYAFDLPFPPL